MDSEHDTERRSSSRSNKGQHSKRFLDEIRVISDEPEHSNEKSRKRARATPHSSRPKSSSSNRDEQDANDENDDEEEEGIVRCTPCGTNQDNYDEANDKGGTFIQCDNCNSWQHALCMGFKNTKSIPELYICDICDPELFAQRKAALETTKPKPKAKPKAKPKTKPVAQKEASPEVEIIEDEPEPEVEPVPEPVVEPEPEKELSIKDVLKDDHRVSTGKAFYNYFKKSFPETSELTEAEKDRKATHWALEIEDIIFRTYPSKSYISEGRRILFLLKKYFMKDIISEKITLEDVVKKTPKEINQDIERVEAENRGKIKNIILRENESTQIVRRTHKGEIIRENENDEPSYMDETVATTRKVDHRNFGTNEDGEAIRPVVVNENRIHSYQNMNPRIQDDNDDEDEYVENQAVSQVTTNDTKSSESSDLEHFTENLDDDDDMYPILGGEETLKNGPEVWSGIIEFPDFAIFNATGTFYSSTNNTDEDKTLRICQDLLPHRGYSILGRLDRLTADAYLDKIVSSRDLFMIEVKSDEHTESQFQKLYQYLLIENKVGVLSGKPAFAKDSYIMPIDFRDSRSPYYLQEHKRDMRIGLFIVFVVKKDYEPSRRSFSYVPSKSSYSSAAKAKNDTTINNTNNSNSELNAIMSQLGGREPSYQNSSYV